VGDPKKRSQMSEIGSQQNIKTNGCQSTPVWRRRDWF